MSVHIDLRASGMPSSAGSSAEPAPKRLATSASARAGPTLAEEGVELVQVVTDPAELVALRAEFRATEKRFPEFKQDVPEPRVYVLGGFAAYANPSSFHNPLVRKLRKLAFDKLNASGALQRFLEGKFGKDVARTYGVELMYDRMMHRFPKQEAGQETPHRDICTKETLQGNVTDILLGGWINLSDQDQTFTCLPGSHKDFKNSYDVAENATQSGFAKLRVPNKANPVPNPMYTAYEAFKRTFLVGPGQMIMFPQYILHEIPKPNTLNTANEQFRLFTCWRMTQARDVLRAAEKAKCIDVACTPPIPSDQVPPMYSANHASAFKNKPFKPMSTMKAVTLMEWWAQNMHDDVRNKVEGKNRDPAQPKRQLTDLAAYGLHSDEYVYTEEDKALMLRVHPLAWMA